MHVSSAVKGRRNNPLCDTILFCLLPFVPIAPDDEIEFAIGSTRQRLICSVQWTEREYADLHGTSYIEFRQWRTASWRFTGCVTYSSCFGWAWATVINSELSHSPMTLSALRNNRPSTFSIKHHSVHREKLVPSANTIVVVPLINYRLMLVALSKCPILFAWTTSYEHYICAPGWILVITFYRKSSK